MTISSTTGALRRLIAVASATAVLGGMFLTDSIVARHEITASRHGAAPVVRFAQTNANTHTKVVAPAHNAANLLPVVDQADIQPKQRILADKVLRALPEGCRQELQNLYVNYEKNPANRGLGGGSVIIVTGAVPDKEFMALLTHECGHVIDIGWLKGSMNAGKSSFVDGNTPIYNDDASLAFYQISWIGNTLNQPGSSEADFVSGYAMSDPFEDFAETFTFYTMHQKEFKRLAKKNATLQAKYDFMAQSVFAGQTPVGDGKYVRGNRAPWDVTRLPYVWHAKK